jgi:aspartate/methionine/tyrosine aminotransferase
MKPLASRVLDIEPFIVMTLLERALAMERRGISIKHFEIGEPDFDTPMPILSAAKSACEAGKTHYTHSLGNLELREAIANYKHKTRGVSIDPQSQIIVTGGTSPAFFMVLGALLNPGDEVILTNPCYSCYPNHLKFFGAVPVYVPIYEQEDFVLQPERLAAAITPKTKLIILNSPANPTGQIIPAKTLRSIADLAIEHDLYVISDEIYAELTYTGTPAPSIGALSEMQSRTIILDGLSKYWAMTGWRVGYIIAPPDLVGEMNKINQNFCICAPSISQEAALAAFTCKSETEAMLATYKNRRDYIIHRLQNIPGISIRPPNGAFYAFANISALSSDSLRFAFDLLDHAHIAATPGIGFGSNGEGYIRFSYCTDISNIQEGMDRLERYLKEGKKN